MLKRSYPSFPKLAPWRKIGKRRVPDSFFRGFSHKGCFTEEGYVTQEGFVFELPKGIIRNDSFEEASINWNDDQHSLRLLCSQRSEKKGDIQFKFGYSEMNLGDVLLAMKPYMQNNHFSYERSPLMRNPYHGNLLIERSLSSQAKRMIRDALASVASINYHKHPSDSITSLPQVQ